MAGKRPREQLVTWHTPEVMWAGLKSHAYTEVQKNGMLTQATTGGHKNSK